MSSAFPSPTRFGARNRAFHAFRAGRQHRFRAKHRQQCAAFDGHRFGHRENQLITLCRCDERQRDAGVAVEARLDDDGVLLENAALLGVLDHRHADTILDAAERIEKFALEDGSRRARAGGDRLFSLTSGVRPTVSMMLL